MVVAGNIGGSAGENGREESLRVMCVAAGGARWPGANGGGANGGEVELGWPHGRRLCECEESMRSEDAACHQGS